MFQSVKIQTFFQKKPKNSKKCLQSPKINIHTPFYASNFQKFHYVKHFFQPPCNQHTNPHHSHPFPPLSLRHPRPIPPVDNFFSSALWVRKHPCLRKTVRVIRAIRVQDKNFCVFCKKLFFVQKRPDRDATKQRNQCISPPSAFKKSPLTPTIYKKSVYLQNTVPSWYQVQTTV